MEGKKKTTPNTNPTLKAEQGLLLASATGFVIGKKPPSAGARWWISPCKPQGSPALGI